MAAETVTWDILMSSIPHRQDTLCELLALLDKQMQPGVRVLLWLDNLELPVGEKMHKLIDASDADYVSCVDDDDLVAQDFVPSVMEALSFRPHYVGFPVCWTRDGQYLIPVEHSLRHGGWYDGANMLLRDISHINPMRRDLALLGPWRGGWWSDRVWADQVRATRKCRTEVWIPSAMYHYRENTENGYRTSRQPWPEGEIKPPPRYPWLRSLGYFPT